jgi:cellulose synthase (UDP-forming)
VTSSVRSEVLRIRVCAVFLFAAVTWYLPWLWSSLNWDAPLLSVPFFAANLIVAASMSVTAVNNWCRSAPEDRYCARGEEGLVGVIIPTCGEPVHMVARTLRSVLRQDWPADRLMVIVSDDAHSDDVRRMVDRVLDERAAVRVIYHRPPRRGDPARRGEAKAGALNSALEHMTEVLPEVDFIETRDADDEVLDTAFLRQTVGQLLADDRVAYVQTIKEARVEPGDPFGNLDPLFYRGSMLARHAANAVFPCGSGLVWRRSALNAIGEFPHWNLVEDLQSGLEALRRGWRGVYLPIVGAVAQSAPEDLPNFYKQRGTWALDTMRLALWCDHRGLTLRQRLQFAELPLFYLQGAAVIVFVVSGAAALLGQVYPLVTTQGQYALRFWPFVVALEACLVALNSGNRFEQLWRTRLLWAGLAPIYLRATVKAVVNGPHRKPTYSVTRKVTRVGWYWRETVPHLCAVALLGVAVTVAISRGSFLTELDLGSVYWALFFSMLALGFIPRSWHGLHWNLRWSGAASYRRRRGSAGATSSLRSSAPSSPWKPRLIALPDGRQVIERRESDPVGQPPAGMDCRRPESTQDHVA